MQSSWREIRCDARGVPLRPGENITKTCKDFSLTVPRMKLGQIGTLTLTNMRLVFSIYNSATAYEFECAKISQMNTTGYEGKPQFAIIKFITNDSEEFSIQAETRTASELIAKISMMSYAHTAATNANRPVKKIIKKLGGPRNTPELVGIAAIQQAANNNINKQNQTLTNALADIDHLKESAQQLMKIAEQLRAKGDSDSKNDLGVVLIALGMSDPVSRETAGKSYSKDLARQFATSIKGFLEKNGGVLSVAEAYCLFNRALGTNYVSPNDLAEALKQLKGREFGVKVDTIEGVTVVILSNKVYSAVITEILTKFGDDEYITPLIISKKTQLPLSIARNYLLRAESEETLCRDDSMAGLRFYKNMFNSFSLMEY